MRLLCITTLITLSSAAFAQSNYHEGYVLKNNGDTLKGFINYRDWAECPTSIDFKINKEDKHVLKFDPHTVKRFQINSLETYIAYAGVISMGRTKFPDLPNDLDTSNKQDTVFLKQIVTGRHLTLFFYGDAIKTRFFIAETNGQPVELKYFQYYGPENKVIEKNTYKGQLVFGINEFFRGNYKLGDQIQSARYTQADLEPIISKINGDTSTAKGKSDYRLFVGFGMNSTKSAVFDGLNYAAISSYSTTLSPKGNLGIDVFINPNVQRFIFRAELSLSYINAGFHYKYGSNANLAEYSFNQYSASITPQLLFNFYDTNDLKIYIDGGFALNWSAYKNNKIITEGGALELEPFWLNFPFQLGVLLNNKTEFSFTYIGYAPYTRARNYSINNQTLGVGIKFMIGGK